MIKGDSYKIIPMLVNAGLVFDHIITDPPYNISKENNFKTMRGVRQGIDFGEWDKGFDYLTWIELAYPLVRDGGSFVVFCDFKVVSHIIDKMEAIGIEFKDVIIWKKTNPMPRNRDRRYAQDKEVAVWGVKPGKWIFNRLDRPFVSTIIETPLVSGKKKNGHPTQKHEILMEQLILTHTDKGQLILDPFMGSGSTGEACLLHGRRFFGIEREDKWFAIAEQRCNETVEQLTLI